MPIGIRVAKRRLRAEHPRCRLPLRAVVEPLTHRNRLDLME